MSCTKFASAHCNNSATRPNFSKDLFVFILVQARCNFSKLKLVQLNERVVPEVLSTRPTKFPKLLQNHGSDASGNTATEWLNAAIHRSFSQHLGLHLSPSILLPGHFSAPLSTQASTGALYWPASSSCAKPALY